MYPPSTASTLSKNRLTCSGFPSFIHIIFSLVETNEVNKMESSKHP